MKPAGLILMTVLFATSCSRDPKQVVVPVPTSSAKTPSKLTDAEVIETRIREVLKKSAGDLTLEDLQRVTQLDLGGVRIRSVDYLATLKGLEVLRLNHNAITDISSLTELKKLRELTVSYNPLGEIAPLAEPNRLEKLYLDGTGLTDLEPLA